jgi:hypothetical protein
LPEGKALGVCQGDGYGTAADHNELAPDRLYDVVVLRNIDTGGLEHLHNASRPVAYAAWQFAAGEGHRWFTVPS